MLEFRRSASRDDRRRRVLTEEVVSGGTTATRTRKTSAQGGAGDDPGSAYNDAAALDRQAQVTDFIPRKQLWLLSVGLGGMTSVGAVAAAHWFRQRALAAGDWSPQQLDALAPLELGAAGSVGAWLTAALLSLAGGLCLLVFMLRRHRRDDYRGRYRVWLSTALLAAAAGVCCVAPLNQVFAALAVHLTGWSASASGVEWWLAPVGLLFAVQAVRLLLEVRRCRVATVLLAIAMVGWLTSLLALPFGPLSQAGGAVLAGGAHLVAALALAVAVLAYARHVVLDIQGLLPLPLPRIQQDDESSAPSSAASRGKSADATEAAESRDTASNSAGGGKARRGDGTADQVEQTALRVAAEYEEYEDEAPVASRRQAKNRARLAGKAQKPAQAADDDYDEEDDLSQAGNRKLSKSDRKRLRKFKAQQRDAA